MKLRKSLPYILMGSAALLLSACGREEGPTSATTTLAPEPAAAPPNAATSADASANAISGTVSGPNGPEAGVWDIAETFDLPTRFARIVVTDDQGRYLIPDLPADNYEVWVRGYGLVDSEKVQASPGANLDLGAGNAP